MCGRFENKATTDILIEKLKNLQLECEEFNIPKTNNISPSESITTLVHRNDKYRLMPMNWGIKFSPDSPLIFNSRIETIKEKNFWQNLFDNNRCIVPMTAFYEWKKEGSRKQPFRIYLPGEDIFFVPALFHLSKEKEYFASLITTTPNKFIKQIHHRMPVILKFRDGLTYLTDKSENNLNRCVPLNDNIKMEMQKVFL